MRSFFTSEEAGRLRNQIAAVERTLERQQIVGEVCAPEPSEEFAPYKILFVIDTSLSNAWNDPEGRREPREFSYDLVERCCRLIYGPEAAPAMAEALREDLMRRYHALQDSQPYRFSPTAMARRSLRNLCLSE